MTKEEAIEMLETALRGDNPSRVNPNLTESQAVDIVEMGILRLPANTILDSILEKRVYQVTRNQREPRY